MSGDFMDRMGKLVRYHRRRAELTQKELADHAGIGKTTVFDMEKGKSTVRMDSLLAVLNVLNMRMEIQGPFVSEFDHREREPENGD